MEITFDISPKRNSLSCCYVATDRLRNKSFKIKFWEGFKPLYKYPTISRYLKKEYNISFNFKQKPEMPEIKGELFPDGFLVYGTGGRRKIYRFQEHIITINDIGREYLSYRH